MYLTIKCTSIWHSDIPPKRKSTKCKILTSEIHARGILKFIFVVRVSSSDSFCYVAIIAAVSQFRVQLLEVILDQIVFIRGVGE